MGSCTRLLFEQALGVSVDAFHCLYFYLIVYRICEKGLDTCNGQEAINSNLLSGLFMAQWQKRLIFLF